MGRKGLGGLTHREPEHFVVVLRAPPPWLLALTCLPQCLPQPCPWPPVLVNIPRCSGSAGGCPGRNGTACAVAALSSWIVLPCRAALLLLLLGTVVGAA